MLLDETLKKLGLKFEELSNEEKATYQQYAEILKGKMTVEKIKEAITLQINFIETEWANPDNSHDKDIFLKAQMRVLKTLLAFIDMPQRSKEQLEQDLKNLK